MSRAKSPKTARHSDFPLPSAPQFLPPSADSLGSGSNAKVHDPRPYARQEHARIVKNRVERSHKRKRSRCMSCGADTRDGACEFCEGLSNVKESYFDEEILA